MKRRHARKPLHPSTLVTLEGVGRPLPGRGAWVLHTLVLSTRSQRYRPASSGLSREQHVSSSECKTKPKKEQSKLDGPQPSSGMLSEWQRPARGCRAVEIQPRKVCCKCEIHSGFQSLRTKQNAEHLINNARDDCVLKYFRYI